MHTMSTMGVRPHIAKFNRPNMEINAAGFAAGYPTR